MFFFFQEKKDLRPLVQSISCTFQTCRPKESNQTNHAAGPGGSASGTLTSQRAGQFGDGRAWWMGEWVLFSSLGGFDMFT